MKVELLGGYKEEELKKRIKNVAAAGKLSRFPGNVLEVLETCDDYDKNLRLVKRIIQMGHKSIIEHDYLVFALCDVTPIIEQTIIGYRLTSFTIKSRREVDFSKVGYYIPEFRNEKNEIHKDNEKLKEEYKKHMQMLFDTYSKIKDKDVKVEDARFILPYSYNSNIIMGVDARELEKMIITFCYGKLSEIQEIKELGNKLLEIARESIPYLVPNLEKQEENLNTGFEFIENNSNRPKINILDKTKLISYTPNSDDVILESAIMYHYQCSKEQAKEILENLLKSDKDAREKMIYEIMHKEERRELEQATFTFQIPISLAILTHLTRHRMQSLLIPEFLPMWDMNNYIIPESVKAVAKDEYEEAVKKNIVMKEKFEKMGVKEADLIYFYLGNQMLNVVTTMNARNVQWICRQRCCNKAQWQIRYIANDIVKLVKEVAPIIGDNLGPTCITDRYCGEGKESCGLIDKLIENDKKIKK